jgi:error-prone DNA polymerase
MMAVKGKLQIEGRVIHVVAESFTNMTDDLVALAGGKSFGDAALAPGDEGRKGDEPPVYDIPRIRHEEAVNRAARAALPKGRNFH